MTWLRRQRVPLIALAVAAVAMVATTVWLDVLPAVRPSDRIMVAETDAEVAGQTVSVTGARWDEFDAPDGTRALSVRLSSTGGTDAASCTISVTDPRTSRTWVSSRDGLDVPYGDDERSCTIEASSYRILAVFLLPDDVEGPLDLDVQGGDHVTARFEIDP